MGKKLGLGIHKQYTIKYWLPAGSLATAIKEKNVNTEFQLDFDRFREATLE